MIASLFRSLRLFYSRWFNSVVVWMVSILLQFSDFSSLFSRLLSAPFTIGIIVIFHWFFRSHARSKYFSTFHFHSVVHRDRNFHYLASSVILVNYDFVWFSYCDSMIRFYLKIPANFMHLLFLDKFWFMHIPFVSMVKFLFLALFPVDHFSFPVILSLVILLC